MMSSSGEHPSVLAAMIIIIISCSICCAQSHTLNFTRTVSWLIPDKWWQTRGDEERVFFLSAKRDLLLGFCSKFWSTWGKLRKVILVVYFQLESAPLEMTTLSQSLSLFSLSLFHPRLVIIANINVFVSSFVCVCARYPMIMIKRCCCCCVHFDIDTASPSAQVYRTRSLAGWLVGLFEWILACQTGVRAPTLCL